MNRTKHNGIDIVELSEELNDYDFDQIPTYKNAAMVVHSYEAGCYDGTGTLIAHIDDKWYYHYMGHCSCCGPIEHMDLDAPYDSLSDLKASCSTELQEDKHTQAVFRWIGKNYEGKP